MQTLEFRSMNTSVFLAAEGEEQAKAGLNAARAFVEESEKRFSRFLPDSELSRLNRSAGEWYPISSDLLELITLSLRYFNETDGLFDPSILPDLKRVGYDKSMDVLKTDPNSIIRISQRTNRPAFNTIEFDLTGMKVRLPKGLELDFGGIAKGWIVEKASQVLRPYASTCAASAGGDINFVGYPSDGSNWQVELEDPRDPGKTIAELFVGECAVVTSSVSKRTWNQDGKVRHHLIDPRTGEPAITDWLSVTVIAPRITEAEVFAKALLIGGEIEAHRLATKHPDLAYITVDSEGLISGSEIGKEYLSEYEYISR